MIASHITFSALLVPGPRGLFYTGIFLLSLMPGLFVYIRLKRSKVQHRRYDLLLFTGGFALTVIVYFILDAPPQLIQAFVIGIVGAIGIIVINRWWDISLHAAIPAGCAALFLPISLPIASVLGVISLAVGLARIPIKQHTLPQVVYG
jgi:hypothetical protein